MTVQRVIVNEEEMLEVTYSRSWSLAVVQYEKMDLFTSIKHRVPVGTDMLALGQKITEELDLLQSTDLEWAANISNNPGSLIHRITTDN